MIVSYLFQTCFFFFLNNFLLTYSGISEKSFISKFHSSLIGYSILFVRSLNIGVYTCCFMPKEAMHGYGISMLPSHF